jgi:hypothetical protein
LGTQSQRDNPILVLSATADDPAGHVPRDQRAFGQHGIDWEECTFVSPSQVVAYYPGEFFSNNTIFLDIFRNNIIT